MERDSGAMGIEVMICNKEMGRLTVGAKRINELHCCKVGVLRCCWWLCVLHLGVESTARMLEAGLYEVVTREVKAGAFLLKESGADSGT